MSQRRALITLAGLSLLGLAGPAIAHGGDGRSGRHKVWPSPIYPPDRAVGEAQQFAAGRGDVSFAVIDRSLGLRGYDYDRRFSSASVSKALLLAAELRRLVRERQPLDSETKALLEPMITYSDNSAADAIYARVGDEGLRQVAERAGMGSFEPVPGYWGGDQITAADIARFFYRLEANLPRPYRRYGMRLLARITSVERWGIPQAIGRGWTVWFKGGWRPPGETEDSGPVTHQAALLEHRRGERLALAVLTNEPPGGSSYETIEGIARRLLSSPPPFRGGWTAP
ncbi:MAG TPA: serine hydrolase [Solirubrobacterales bacterium]|nr:serine hydrolase [Solirubrobacterales bacterium]